MKEDQKKKSPWLLSAVVGTALVVACVIVYALLSSLLCNLTLKIRFGEEIACALLPLSITVIIVSFALFEGVLVVRELCALSETKNRKKIIRITACVSILASLLLAVVHANTYTRFDEDSIDKVCFVEYKSYTWIDRNDVVRYSLSCNAEGEISCALLMRDGEKVEILRSVNSCSKAFLEKYKNMYAYAAYLSRELDKSEYIVDKRIIGEEYMERYYKDTYPEIWSYLEEIINGGNT